MSREDSYSVVQDLAMRVWKREGSLKELVLKDRVISSKAGKEEIDAIFDIKRYYKNIEAIYRKAGIGQD